ncbi:DUF4381 domain-containing protein [Seongchinamella unica]|uniref:DUF4381 domain-containing protein n=1 Tax=Seongchinamella unica TaxID=2547392 RepID=A0A4R5LNK5_9GAMM|nr:DUF4381 domain-containing protein [Seongchinamella unica]TDG11932.1 DUF4381 domain-containing protein [Seongchinamella unica]
MNPADPLAQLHPLREPAAIGWWPPAPGWWLLLALVIVGLAAVAWGGLRRYRRNAYRRRGLAQLAQIRSRWLADNNHLRCLSEANALLKAVALRAYPVRDVAGISGRDWQDFLDQTMAGNAGFELRLLQAQYLGEVDGQGLDEHLHQCASWIKRHRVSA